MWYVYFRSSTPPHNRTAQNFCEFVCFMGLTILNGGSIHR